MGNFNEHHKSGWYAVSFGPCRKLPGIFSYRIITAEEFPRAHARTRTEGPIEVLFNAAFVCSLVRLFVLTGNKIARVSCREVGLIPQVVINDTLDFDNFLNNTRGNVWLVNFWGYVTQSANWIELECVRCLNFFRVWIVIFKLELKGLNLFWT